MPIGYTNFPGDRELPDCAWCGDSEFPGPYRTVCDRCLNLLRNAGIPDDEIYGREPGDKTMRCRAG